MDPEIEQLLHRVRVGAAGPEDAKALERHLTSDSMIPEIRNKLAYNHHIQQHGNAGIHVHVDLNDFGLINKRFGDHVGDEAITKAGKAIAQIGKKWGGRVFRSGGDEFKLWFLQPHHAENFSKDLHKHLSLSDDIAGSHKLSACIGIGHTRERAEDALVGAKGELKTITPDGMVQRAHPEGKSPTVVKSHLIKGSPDGWMTAEESIQRAHQNQS
jgi:GGDEF domain-containing protein